MSHNHGGCYPSLQIVMVIMGLFAIGLAMYGLEHDSLWNKDLEVIKRSFTQREVDLLWRQEPALEILFCVIIGICTILIFAHFVLSLRLKKDDLYGTKYSRIFHISVLVANLIAFFMMVASVRNYDSNYSKIEAGDKRVYRFEFLNNRTLVNFTSPHSIYYYCHLGNGKLTHSHELKGLRIKKTGAKLCQNLSAKLVAAVFSVYIAVLCYTVMWFISVGDRYIDGTTLARLFELYGDAEEFARDHPHHPNPGKEVAEFREKLKFQTYDDVDEIVDPKLEEEMKTRGPEPVDMEIILEEMESMPVLPRRERRKIVPLPPLIKHH